MNATSAGDVLLTVENVHTFYGTIEALKGISIEVREGEIVTLIGANGAGKSTTLRSINGLNQPREGSIVFRGKDITRTAAARHRRHGHLAVAGGPAALPAHDACSRTSRWARSSGTTARRSARTSTGSTGSSRASPSARTRSAGTLSGGEQQMCAIGRALMARPKLLMLDEPSMGLAPIFVEKIFEIIGEINEQGTTILLVEQNALMALDAAQRGYVLETGRVALADDAKSLRENEQVRKTYLGET